MLQESDVSIVSDQIKLIGAKTDLLAIAAKFAKDEDELLAVYAKIKLTVGLN